MLNKIKDKILHVLRNYCGYYSLKREYTRLKQRTEDIEIESEYKLKTLMTNFNQINIDYDKLFSKHEAKILEYDILKNNIGQNNNLEYQKLLLHYEDLIREIGICDTYGVYSSEDEIKIYNEIKQNDYKKYLVSELEEILNIMKEKGVHPQDLIKRIINKANRDLKE